jgi:hypothetical protein
MMNMFDSLERLFENRLLNSEAAAMPQGKRPERTPEIDELVITQTKEDVTVGSGGGKLKVDLIYNPKTGELERVK